MTSLIDTCQCIVCGSDRHEPALDGLLRRCAACAFHWTADRPGRIDTLYDESYYETESYRQYFDRAEQWRYEATRRLRWLLSAVRPRSLVEAGPAGGFFLEAARQAGIDATGVEVSEVAGRYAREQLGVPVQQGVFEEVVLPAPVDAVCAFHVLEHVEDPATFLHAARDRLVTGGWLALEVPNLGSVAARRAGASWVDLAPRYHHWHFDADSLTRLVAGCGFAVTRVDTLFATGYLRPRRLLTRWGAAGSWRVFRATGSFRSSHPRLGDYLRLVARRTEGARHS
ncbi:class I SAM-dependent methyltransferase [Plantactinospora siamensis]|uniref:Class I SAM-dependent methyltransferase n=1 Tax=Plantactinospora siamensis TaxID=555372 RepID=A0ABV6P688_9ACTN